RRLTLAAAGVVLVAAVGVGTWAATSGDSGGDSPDTKNSAPASP
ncbi:serine/threonine protein kinase, partial [Streptomyces prunicolor]|nr:serine/threonine protein kinase [Streptomyces prunicolor]